MGGRTLFRDLSLILSPGVRVGLLGSNGSGKTTLLKILEGDLAPDQGTIRRADLLKVVTFAQDRTERLDLEKSLRRTLCPEGDSVIYRGRPIHVAGWAKRFLFRSDQLEMPVSSLSGGERARVLIARLMLQTADVLLLDEPANDLDIPTLEVLEQSLLDFPGAIVLVSHDRYLLDRVSTIVIALDGSGDVSAFADYSQWEAARGERIAEKPVVKERDAPVPVQQKKLSYIDQLEWDAMEKKIVEAEKELASWHQEVQDASSDANRLPHAFEQLQQAQARVDALYQRWAELEAKVPK
jgi:ATP-binding cassette subfamily F protein uup